MNDAQLQTIEQIRAFLAGSEVIAFSVEEAQERYVFIVSTLVRFGYWKRSKAEKGLLRRYLGKIIGYFRAQIPRLIADYRTRGRLGDDSGPAHGSLSAIPKRMFGSWSTPMRCTLP